MQRGGNKEPTPSSYVQALIGTSYRQRPWIRREGLEDIEEATITHANLICARGNVQIGQSFFAQRLHRIAYVERYNDVLLIVGCPGLTLFRIESVIYHVDD